jgi:hypothetical protein
MLLIAENYEKLAQRAEERLRNKREGEAAAPACTPAEADAHQE